MPDPLSIPPYTIHILETGTFGLDGGAMFGSVPKALWARTIPADEANRIEQPDHDPQVPGVKIVPGDQDVQISERYGDA